MPNLPHVVKDLINPLAIREVPIILIGRGEFGATKFICFGEWRYDLLDLREKLVNFHIFSLRYIKSCVIRNHPTSLGRHDPLAEARHLGLHRAISAWLIDGAVATPASTVPLIIINLEVSRRWSVLGSVYALILRNNRLVK